LLPSRQNIVAGQVAVRGRTPTLPSEQAAEQVALGGGEPVAGFVAAVVVGAGAG